MERSLRVPRTAVFVRQQAASNIRKAILDGRFVPGQRLVERELCDLTGVSRTSIREALRQLESEGLVQVIPRRGPIVARVTVTEAENLYQVRALLEGLAGRLFAERATDEQMAALAERVAGIEAAYQQGDARGLLRAKNQFYAVLLRGCGNDVVRSLLRTLHTRVTFLRALTLSRPDRPAQSLAEIRAILRALQARDPEAAWKSCVSHVEAAAAVAIQALREEQPGMDREGSGQTA